MGFPVLWYDIRLSVLVGLRWEHSKSIYKNPYIRIISSISKSIFGTIISRSIFSFNEIVGWW